VSVFTLSVLVGGALVAAYTDLRTRQISNLLTGAMAVFALGLSIPGGITSVATAALVMLAAFIAGTFAFSLGWFGGGDVKLLAACCGFAKFPGAVELVFYTFLAGGVVALIDVARRRQLRSTLFGLFQIVGGVKPTSTSGVPYGVAIAGGTCAYALSTLSTFHFLRLPI
jgi:prepilin peptidase CpaA